MIKYSILLLSAMLLSSGTIGEKKVKPTVWLIGDSTVKNGSGKGAGGYGDGETICIYSLIQQKYLSGILHWGEKQ